MISFIIPCYNVCKYLNDCVNSIIMQNIEDKEIIIIDDGSTDGTQELISSLELQLSCVKSVIHENNMGQEDTRNDGLKIASGDWILFVDADDIITDNSLTPIIARLKDEDIIIGRFTYFDEFTSHVSKCGLKPGAYSSKEIASNIGVTVTWDVISCIGNKLYSKDFIIDNNLKFEKKYKYNEDGAFAVNAFNSAKIIRYTDDIWYNYRFNPSGVMSSYKKNSFFSLDSVNKLVELYFMNKSIVTDKELFVNKKRIGSLISSLGNEIKMGRKKDFYEQVEEILSDTDMIKWICNVKSDVRYDPIEIEYLRMIWEKEWDVLFEFNKKEVLSQFYKQWLQKKMNGLCIADCIWDKKIKHVSIYGAGEIGRLVAYELAENDITVDCFLDVSETGVINGSIPVINPETDDIPKTTELIINTVLIWNRDVEEYIISKIHMKVMGFRELI